MALPAAVVGGSGEGAARRLAFGYGYGAIALGSASLLANAWRPQTPDARRKIQVVTWGTAVGVLPATTLELAQELGGPVPDWLMALGFVALFAFPLSFAYAVVVHRVLELPVLLKRSARYVLVRRGFGVLSPPRRAWASGSPSPRSRPRGSTARPGGSTGPSSAMRTTRGSSSRSWRRGSAPSPARESSGICSESRSSGLCGPGGSSRTSARRTAGCAPPAPRTRPSCPGRRPASPTSSSKAGHATSLVATAGPSCPRLAPLAPDYVVPCVVRGELVGLVVLGPRLSEEPYSGEDGRLPEHGRGAGRRRPRQPGPRRPHGRADRSRAPRRARDGARPAGAGPAAAPEGRRLRRLECEGRCVQARAVGATTSTSSKGATAGSASSSPTCRARASPRRS